MNADVLITRGTYGKRNWYYANCNPLIIKNKPSIFKNDYDCWLISDADEGKPLHEDKWVPKTEEERSALFTKALKNDRWGGHSYKCALLRIGTDTDPYGYSVYCYCNAEGKIDRVRFDSLTGEHETSEYIRYNYYRGLWGNFDLPNSIGGVDGSITFYGGLPMFIYEETIDGKNGEERMQEYLLDDGDGNNWADYGGIAPGDDTPIEDNDDNNVSEDIDGLGGGTGGGTSGGDFTDSNSSIISNGVLGQDGMIKSAKLNSSDYKALGSLIGKGWLAGNIGQGVINIKLLRTPGVLPVGEYQRIIDASGTFHDYAVSGYPIEHQYIAYNVGSFTFNEQFGNFLDYSPYTDIKIYLPYCGLQSLDAQTVVGKTINVKCVIDILSGNLVYYLFTKTSGGQTCLYSWNGNCSIEIPISADDYGRKVSATINAGTTALATLMNPGLGAVAGIGSAGINYAQNSSQHMIMGNVSANNGFGGIQYPYLVISRPNPKIPSNFGHTTGYLSMKNMTLGNCKGFTKVQDVHLHGINGATQEELNEISSLLKQGVIL